MRIIRGKYKGRRFAAPKKLPVRPTTDYAKEALFNILENQYDWNETRFLDLFTGIGSISLEAASRGAQRVTAVDRHGPNLYWIRQQLELIGEKNVDLVRNDAIEFVKRSELNYEIVFADPPYAYDRYDALIEAITEKLQQSTVFILEHRKGLHFSEHPNFVDEKNYGEVAFSFFEK